MTLNASLQQLTQDATHAYQTEEFELAARKYEAAEKEYGKAGDALMAAEMANNRSVALLKSGNPTAAYTASAGTDQVFAKAGDTRRQAVALSNQASALEAMHKHNQALDLYRQAGELFKTVGERDMRVYVLKSMSMLQFKHGNRLEAMATMRMALEAQQKLTLRDRILKSLLGIVFKLLGGQ